MGKPYINKQGLKAIRYTPKDKAKQAERKTYELYKYQFLGSDSRNEAKRINQFLAYYAVLSSGNWPTLSEVQTSITQIETWLKREYSTDLNTASHARQSVILMPKHVKRDGGKLTKWDHEYLMHWRNRIVHYNAELRFWRAIEYIAIYRTHPLYYVIKR